MSKRNSRGSIRREVIHYRVYADGEVVHEDDFNEKDSELPYYDDYREYEVTNVTINWALPSVSKRQSI